MNTIRLIALSICVLLASFGLQAQTDHLVEALRHYQAGELAQARDHIDRAVTGPVVAGDPEAWLLRGFVYKDLYKDLSSGPEADQLRETAMESLEKCLMLDSAHVYRENALQAREFLVRSYFNDAAKALNAMDDERALMLYGKYREATLRANPNAQLNAREVEFTNALGTVYTKRFNQARTDTVLFAKAIDAYKHVLELDPENYGANYNLATLYFNRGVFRIREISAENDIPSIEMIQMVARGLFLQALPYMLKAHDMNPTRRETLLGLEGIYYSLQDENNADKFRRLFEEMQPQE